MAGVTFEIVEGLHLPLSLLRFETARSSGPGGQHVNKTETKVTAVLTLADWTELDDSRRSLLTESIGSRLTGRGELRVSSQSHRSQKANREEAIERLVALLRDALTPRAERKPTRIPPRVKRQRMDDKRKRSEKKRTRRATDWDS